VVATNQGDLKLSRAVKTILEQDPEISAVYCMAEGKDGVITIHVPKSKTEARKPKEIKIQ